VWRAWLIYIYIYIYIYIRETVNIVVSPNVDYFQNLIWSRNEFLLDNICRTFNKILIYFFLSMAQEPLLGHHYRGFTITLRHTTFGRIPLDEWSTRRRDRYLTTHDIHKTETHAHGGNRIRNPNKRAAVNLAATEVDCFLKLINLFLGTTLVCQVT
jgi:hypothetical protein